MLTRSCKWNKYDVMKWLQLQFFFFNKSKTSELKHQQWPGGASLKKTFEHIW